MQVHSPESVGISSHRLARITPVMEGFVEGNQLPGIMTLLQRQGKVVQFGMYGLMDIEAGKLMHENALFRIYSMTKPIVSVAMMMLYEEGRFSLKDPVSKFIPAFGETKVYAGSSKMGLDLVKQDPVMTIHHLLTHTSGLSYGWFFDSPVERLYREVAPDIFPRETTLEYVVERLAALPLLFQPGTQWRYSFATDVVGLLIQILADMPLADFLEERIFQPLGMVDTAFHVPAKKLDRLAQIYESKKLYDPVIGKPRVGSLVYDATIPTQRPSGGGGLISTLDDYLRFCNCLLDNDSQLIGRKTLEWMTSNHIPRHLMPLTLGPNTLDFGFGLGFRVTTSLGEARALTSVGEYGWSGAAQTYFWIDPMEEMIGIFMTQHVPVQPYPVKELFKNMAYQAIVD